MSSPYMSDILTGLQHNHWPLSTPRLAVAQKLAAGPRMLVGKCYDAIESHKRYSPVGNLGCRSGMR